MLLRSFPSFFYGNLHDFYKSPVLWAFYSPALDALLKIEPGCQSKPTDSGPKDLRSRLDGFTLQKTQCDQL